MRTKTMAAKAKKSTELDQSFWSRFADSFWERRPLVVRNVKSRLLELDEAEIFALLVRYSDRCRKLKDPEGFKFYIDGIKAYEHDVLQVLPEKKDKSLAGFHARMNHLFSDYCLVCDELLRVNYDKQDLLTEFTDELYRHVGFPNRFSEMGLYLGNYRKTPFGVHVDRCGVFSFPVAGKKKFRLWTSAFVKKNPELVHAFNYSKFKRSSQLLEAEPGDLAYWPSSTWHIAESDGSFSATWSLGVWVDRAHKDTLGETVTELLSDKLGATGELTTTRFEKLHRADGQIEDLPASYQESIAILQNLSAEELRAAFAKQWMKHISRRGFKSIPQNEFIIKLSSKVRLASSPILWLPQGSGATLSFGGISRDIAQASHLLRFVKAVNAGRVCKVTEYLKGPTKSEDLKVLRTLGIAGAFSDA